MFCALSQNYQHLVEKYIYMCNLTKILRKTQNGIEILVGQAVFKLWIKTVKIMFLSITSEGKDWRPFSRSNFGLNPLTPSKPAACSLKTKAS